MDFNRWREFRYIKILLLFCTCGTALRENTCIKGATTAGYTLPHGDIIVEYGKPLNITCVLNNESFNGSLSFTRGEEPIPSEMIDVVNSTVIKLHIDKPPLSSSITYTCLLNKNTSVCMNTVSVGTAPQDVTDFKCIGYNWDNLTCTWTVPENHLKTTYNLTYTFGPSRSERPIKECPMMSVDPRNPSIMSCFWNLTTTPLYRQVQPTYYFNLFMNNSLGSNQMSYTFNHFSHVLSGPPENITVISTTTSSVYLYWTNPLSMESFVKGLQYRVLYQREKEKTWNEAEKICHEVKGTGTFCNITNLKYAHALYDIRVSLRANLAMPDDESMWSNNASITVQTSSKIPDAPPKTDVGSFEIVAFSSNLEHREAYVYWQQIPQEQQNGRDFRYRISVRGNDSIKLEDQTYSYAKFTNLNIFSSYIFDIWSENINGTSLHKSSVFVPRQPDRIKEPLSFTKVEYSEGHFELTWEAPELPPNQYITNYTIFSCEYSKDRPYQCSGMLHWETIPSNRTSHTINVTTPSQFAISANSHNSSSGMLWASCTVIHNKNMGKLKNVWINKVDSTSIQVGWKLDCSDRIGSVEGYIVYYCPIVSPTHMECKAPQANMTFNGTTVLNGNITNLKPYTTYMLTVSVITRHTTLSQQSDPLYNTTLEAAPTGEIDLKVVRRTNSSITIAWKLSEPSNGVLRYFDIKCYRNFNERPIEKKFENPSVSKQYTYTFDNLTSYENYTITIAACTVSCGEEATVISETLMGHASKISKPTVDRRNDTSITITWNKPIKAGGNNDYYVVKFKKKYRQQNRTYEYNTTTRKYVITNCGDDGKFNTFYISVKAVNVKNGTIYDGPWSDELENYCDTPVNFIMYILLLGVIAALISIGFAFTRLYHRCKVMRDVEVKLPPGLAPVVTDQSLVQWGTEKHQENRISHAPPDEELLLVKMTEGRHFSGDSSGCSSGHESVTSSLESGTHISSSSDSGTEQPGNYGNYCSLGVNPKLDSSYIPVSADSLKLSYKGCDNSSEASPYVMTGEAVKTVNPGYIAFNTPEPTDKSSGYVMAGTKNMNGYIPFNQTDAVSRNTGYVVAGVKNCKLD